MTPPVPLARLLVAHGDAARRDYLVRCLRDLGHGDIACAQDGACALALNAAGAFDVILLIATMPGEDSVAVLAELRARGLLDTTPVIMIAASADPESVVRCLELGAEDYLRIPFDPRLLGARLASVLEKRRLRTELQRQLTRLDAELAEAHDQQLSMVPTRFPPPMGPVPVVVHGTMRPAREVGGDFYDCFEVSSGLLCVAVGDVSGKGMPAALFMARARGLVRAITLLRARLLGRVPEPDEVAREVNEELCKNNPAWNFVTLFLCFIDTETGTFRFLNAGHVAPWILSERAPPRELDAPPDVPLAFDPDAGFRVGRARLEAGETCVIVSDGVYDMEAADGSVLGKAAVRDCLAEAAHQGPDALVAHLLTRVLAFGAGAVQADDVTILAFRRGPPR